MTRRVRAVAELMDGQMDGWIDVKARNVSGEALEPSPGLDQSGWIGGWRWRLRLRLQLLLILCGNGCCG